MLKKKWKMCGCLFLARGEGGGDSPPPPSRGSRCEPQFPKRKARIERCIVMFPRSTRVRSDMLRATLDGASLRLETVQISIDFFEPSHSAHVGGVAGGVAGCASRRTCVCSAQSDTPTAACRTSSQKCVEYVVLSRCVECEHVRSHRTCHVLSTCV